MHNIILVLVCASLKLRPHHLAARNTAMHAPATAQLTKAHMQSQPVHTQTLYAHNYVPYTQCTYAWPYTQYACVISAPCVQRRQEMYRQTYTQLRPIHAAPQQLPTLQILPSFAKPQTLSTPDGSMIFLEPEPYLHKALDIVNHTADTAVDHGTASRLRQPSTAKFRGQPVNMPQPLHAAVTRSDLLIAITSSADRSYTLMHAAVLPCSHAQHTVQQLVFSIFATTRWLIYR